MEIPAMCVLGVCVCVWGDQLVRKEDVGRAVCQKSRKPCSDFNPVLFQRTNGGAWGQFLPLVISISLSVGVAGFMV